MRLEARYLFDIINVWTYRGLIAKLRRELRTTTNSDANEEEKDYIPDRTSNPSLRRQAHGLPNVLGRASTHRTLKVSCPVLQLRTS